jgi:hypothetical protein
MYNDKTFKETIVTRYGSRASVLNKSGCKLLTYLSPEEVKRWLEGDNNIHCS